MKLQYSLLFLFSMIASLFASKFDHLFTECCKQTVSHSCATHCKYHSSVIRYSWPFLKGDCDWEKERDSLRHCMMNMKDQTECCEEHKVGESGYKFCQEICNGTLATFSYPIAHYLPCRHYVKEFTKCGKSSW